MTFQLHKKLKADTIEIAQWSVSRVLLMNDATYPWIILVPSREGLVDFHDISLEDEESVYREINRASLCLKKITGAKKINMAALGNMVPQLHIHIIARFEDDRAWPAPVWGRHAGVPYEKGKAEDLIERFLAQAGSV